MSQEVYEAAKREELARHKAVVAELKTREACGEDVERELEEEHLLHRKLHLRLYRQRNRDGYKEGREECIHGVILNREANKRHRQRHPEKYVASARRWRMRKQVLTELYAIDEGIFA